MSVEQAPPASGENEGSDVQPIQRKLARSWAAILDYLRRLPSEAQWELDKTGERRAVGAGSEYLDQYRDRVVLDERFRDGVEAFRTAGVSLNESGSLYAITERFRQIRAEGIQQAARQFLNKEVTRGDFETVLRNTTLYARGRRDELDKYLVEVEGGSRALPVFSSLQALQNVIGDQSWFRESGARLLDESLAPYSAGLILDPEMGHSTTLLPAHEQQREAS